MKFKKILLFVLLSCFAYEAAHASLLSAFKQDVLGIKNGVTKQDLQGSLEEQFLMRSIMPGLKNGVIGCGCAVKNRAWGLDVSPEYGRQVTADNFKSKPNIMLYGDSRFHFMLPQIYGQYWGEYYHNAAFGGSTSGDLKKHFDRCSQRASWNYHFSEADFYPPSPGMDAFGSETRDHLGLLAPVQLENTVGIVLSGGNDINMYKPVLKIFPFLVPLRVNNIVNNLNRVVSYHQAQNTNLIIASQIPLPAGDTRGWFDYETQKIRSKLQQSLALYNRRNVVREVPVENSGDIKMGTGASIILSNLSTGSIGGLSIGVGHLIIGHLLSDSNGDKLWVSNILHRTSLMTLVLVSHQRKTGFIDLWSVYKQPGIDLPVSRNEFYYDNVPGSLNDGIHPSVTGNLAMIATIREYMQAHSLERSRVPEFSTTGDRCQYLDQRHLPSGQPATWTPEPEPLPEANDDLLFLIGACVFTGNCKP